MKERSERHKKTAIDFTQELVRIPSHSYQEIHAAVRIEQQMRELEYDKVFRDDAGNVVGILLGRESEPTVLLISHIDTIHPQEDLWDGSPYSGRIDNGRLFGVGASDCKGGLAAQVFAGDLLKRSLLPLKGNLVVAATVAEANGQSVGVRHLLEQTLPEQGLKPTYAILGEPTELGLYYGHDGWVEIEVSAEGSNPFQVDDATQAIFEDFNSNYNPDQSGGRSDGLKIHHPQFEDRQGSRLATIQMSRRLSPEEEIDDIIGQIKHDVSLVTQAMGDVAVNVALRRENKQLYNGKTTTIHHIVNAWSTDPFSRLIERSRQTLAAADCNSQPGKWKLEHRGMGTSGGMLVKRFNVPTVGYGPGAEHLAHTPNEYVEVEKIHTAVYGTAAIVQDLIGYPVFGWTSDDI